MPALWPPVAITTLVRGIQTAILRLAIRLAKRRPTGSVIPRSLPRARGLDAFHVEIGWPGDPATNQRIGRGRVEWQVLVDKVIREGLNGRWFDGRQYDQEVSVSNAALAQARLLVIHYIETSEFIYRHPAAFILGQMFGYDYLRIFWGRLGQKLFNRRSLARQGRLEVLHFVYDQTMREYGFSTNATQIATALYGPRWTGHPDRALIQNYYRLIIDSLVDTNDLTRQGYSVTLTAQALHTLAVADEADRRHWDDISQQRIMAALTAVLILVGLSQVYIGWPNS